MKIIPIKLLIQLNSRILENNKNSLKETKDKKKIKDLKAVSLVFQSNLHYLEKYCKKENLDPLEMNVSEETLQELLGTIKGEDN